MGIHGDPGTMNQDWEKRLRDRFCKESDKNRHSVRKVFFFFLLGSNRIPADSGRRSVLHISSSMCNFHLSKTSFSEVECVPLTKTQG